MNARHYNETVLLSTTNCHDNITSKILIKNGAEIHHAAEDGCTALHRAARWGMPDVLHMLIQTGANVHAVDKDNRTALWYAADAIFPGNKFATSLLHLICAGAKIDEETIKRNENGVLRMIEERLELLRAGERIGTSLMSEEERRFMWNLAFFFTFKHGGAAGFKAFQTIRSFITFKGIFMAHGYDLGVESLWRKYLGEEKHTGKYHPDLEVLQFWG